MKIITCCECDTDNPVDAEECEECAYLFTEEDRKDVRESDNDRSYTEADDDVDNDDGDDIDGAGDGDLPDEPADGDATAKKGDKAAPVDDPPEDEPETPEERKAREAQEDIDAEKEKRRLESEQRKLDDDKKRREIGFSMQDVQDYYSAMMLQGKETEEAIREVKTKFKLPSITVSPTGRVKAPGVPMPPPPTASMPPLDGQEGEPPPEDEPAPPQTVAGEGVYSERFGRLVMEDRADAMLDYDAAKHFMDTTDFEDWNQVERVLEGYKYIGSGGVIFSTISEDGRVVVFRNTEDKPLVYDIEPSDGMTRALNAISQLSASREEYRE